MEDTEVALEYKSVYDEVTDTWKRVATPVRRARRGSTPSTPGLTLPPSPPDGGRGRSTSSQSLAADPSLDASVRMVRELTEIITRMEEMEGSDDPQDRSMAITELSRLIENAYGEDAAMIGDFMRECGGIELLIECAQHSS